MECVILAGGLGTRMRPLTSAIPKAMIPVVGRPFIDFQLEWLAAQGVERVVLSVGYKSEVLKRHVGDGRRYGVNLSYVDDGRELRGTAGALRLALECGALGESFIVLYGDSYLPVSLRPVWQAFLAGTDPALMTVLRNEGRWDGSNVRYADGRVLLYDKSAAGEALEYIDYGLSVLSRQLVEDEILSGRFADLADVFKRLSQAGRLAGYEVHNRFYEVGSPIGLAELEAHLTATPPPGG